MSDDPAVPDEFVPVDKWPTWPQIRLALVGGCLIGIVNVLWVVIR